MKHKQDYILCTPLQQDTTHLHKSHSRLQHYPSKSYRQHYMMYKAGYLWKYPGTYLLDMFLYSYYPLRSNLQHKLSNCRLNLCKLYNLHNTVHNRDLSHNNHLCTQCTCQLKYQCNYCKGRSIKDIVYLHHWRNSPSDTGPHTKMLHVLRNQLHMLSIHL